MPAWKFLGDQYILPRSHCIGCGAKIISATAINHNQLPRVGCGLVCYRCGHIMVFDVELRMRDMTDDEMYRIAGDPTLIAVQKGRARAMAKKNGSRGSEG
jgi:hypothetical protein